MGHNKNKKEWNANWIELSKEMCNEAKTISSVDGVASFTKNFAWAICQFSREEDKSDPSNVCGTHVCEEV